MARATHCTTITDAWDGFGTGWTIMTVIAGLSVLATAVIVVAEVFFVSAWSPAALLAAGITLLAACSIALGAAIHVGNYIFDHRLVCIEDSKCAIGKVILIEENEDGDRSLDLLLAPAIENATPTHEATTAAEYQFTFWQSKELIFKDHVDLPSRGWHLSPKGNRGAERPFGAGENELPFFHCEIEGSKIDTWLKIFIAWLIALMAIATTAIVVASVAVALSAIPVVGLILNILFALFALFAIIFGFDYLSGGDAANVPVDNLGEATPSDMGPVVTDSAGNNIQNGDIILINGRFITDTGHNPGCWNEFHPVRGIAKMKDTKAYFSVGTDTASELFIQYCEALKNHINNFGTVSQGLTYLEHPKIG